MCQAHTLYVLGSLEAKIFDILLAGTQGGVLFIGAIAVVLQVPVCATSL